MTERKKRDRKFIMIMLALLSVGLLLISGVLFYEDKASQKREEARIFSEVGGKKPQDITPREMTVLLKMSTRTSQTDFEKFLETGAVKWILTQNDPKDYMSLNIVAKFDFEQTIFFQTSIRSNSKLAQNLESMARGYGTEISHIAVEPVPPSQGFFSFVTSGQGIVLIVLIAVIGFGAVWSVTRGPLSGLGPFSKSNANLVLNEKITFDDIAGVDEAVTDVKEVIDLFKIHARNKQLGVDKILPRMHKGVLLIGPPGTGKTLISKASANRAKVPFYEINGASFVQMFVGVGPRRVRELFNQARRNAPAIVFIDEIDAVGSKRSQGALGGDKEYSNTVNALLGAMDGFDKNIPVLVIAATNREDAIDEALLRPGRFTRKIFVDLPDRNGRIEILKIHMRELTKHGLIAENINLGNLSAQISGFSGDDISNLVNEAHILAIRRWDKQEIGDADRKVESADFEASIDKVAFGSEKKSRVISETEKRRIAIHEVGHLMTCYKLEQESEDRVYKISIVNRGRTGGHVRPLPSDNMFMTKEQLIARLAFYAGGITAEEIYFNGNISNSASYDISTMTRVAYDMVTRWTMGSEDLGFRSFEKNYKENYMDYSQDTAHQIDKEVAELTWEAKDKAKTIILENKEKFDYMVQRILEAETLQGDELREILEQ